MDDTGKTRLMAVIHADVVDYSGHVRRDRERAAVAVGQRFALFDQIAKARGAEHTTHEGGDSFLALLPSAQAAVDTAVEAQQRFQQLNDDDPGSPPIHVRMGVYMGDVYTTAGKPVGDAVNRAARLQAIAPAGGVCMSAGVYDEVRSRLAFAAKDMGEQPLKGFDAPVRSYAVPVYTPPVVPGGGPAPAPESRAPYVPRVGKEPTDQDKQQFVRLAFKTIRDHFRQGVQAMEKQLPQIRAEVEDVDARRFVARAYVNGREEAVVTIWLGVPFHSGMGICVSDQDQGSGPSNSYNEILDVSVADGKVFLSATLGLHRMQGDYDPSRLLPKDAADYLWRRFAERLER